MTDIEMIEPPIDNNDSNESIGKGQPPELAKCSLATAEVDVEITANNTLPGSNDESLQNISEGSQDKNQQTKRRRKNPDKKEVEEDDNSFNSIEMLISVPLHCILRRTSSQNANNPHLLSRMEASLLLQITTLAYELDSLFQMSIEAIEKSHTCKIISEDIHKSGNVFLRPIHCLLYTHGRVIPQQVIQHVQNNVESILGHFPVIIQSLRQCAEQNWSVSNALLDMDMAGMSVNMLGKEKGLLAEMEEEVCKRLEILMDVCNELDTSKSLNQMDSNGAEPMEEFCNRLFGNEETRSGSNNEVGKGMQKLQHRSASINDAATALGLLASAGRKDFDDESSGVNV